MILSTDELKILLKYLTNDPPRVWEDKVQAKELLHKIRNYLKRRGPIVDL